MGTSMTLDQPAHECVPSVLFQILWETLNDIMGGAATAILVRRAVKHAAQRSPGCVGLAIVRERYEYRYALPESWNSAPSDGLESLKGLATELRPLLFELTGHVVLRRLHNVPELDRCGLFTSEVCES
jgi:hypothetical protein